MVVIRDVCAAASCACCACCARCAGGTLRDYQLDGLNWMVYSWSRGSNGILAGAVAA